MKKQLIRIYLDWSVISLLRDVLSKSDFSLIKGERRKEDGLIIRKLLKIEDDKPYFVQFCLSDDSHHELEKITTDSFESKILKNDLIFFFQLFEKIPRIKLGHSIKYGENYRWGCGAIWASEQTDDYVKSIELDLMKWSGSKRPNKFFEDSRHLSNMLVKGNMLETFLTVDYKLLGYRDKIYSKYRIIMKRPIELYEELKDKLQAI